ncbi:unnamed protein product [Brassicogethes aeneus]|uniref:Nose resistant-to-fluoxetine protein N-terminal domain-containing protein n=1 Tax=Brassicogethes aeneus TaxID=1431903 RepID=A0A9P0B936_BRAAE|nr:unnamed protein product [Brassicogethes aeneus]
MRKFAFIVIIYFVLTRINCDINSSYVKFKYSLSNLTLKNDVKIELDIEENVLSEEERGKLCVKNFTKCRNNDIEYEVTSTKLSQVLFSRIPPFDLSGVKGVSQSCQRDSRTYVQDLAAFKFWALQMYDSTAKLPSGLMNGNVNQLGDFDMCLSSKSEEENIHGKYCLASMQVDNPHSSYLSGIYRLLQSHMHFKSKLEDPGHRVPRFSSINWALCVPSSCTPTDVELGLKKTVNKFIEGTDLKVQYEVDPAMCQSKSETKDIPDSTKIAVGVFSGVILLCIFASLYDSYTIKEKQNEWIVAFSLKKNYNSMFTISRNTNDIEAVHGIRFLNAILLVFAHKSMALFFVPWANRTQYVEYVSQPWTVVGRAASLYTDPFIMFSGTLTTYALLGRLQRTQKLNLFQEYVSRLMRIVPTFAALIAFCTFVLPWLNNGPTWNLVVTHHSDICKQNWWRNLLFIHNYYGFKEMCLTHTHHIGIDTQLFFASPFLVYLLWRWPKKGSVTLITIASISTVMRYYVTYTMRLSNYVHFGTSIQQLFDTADHMYILPAHRATVYIMGIFLGYILKFYRSTTLTNRQLQIGNAVALFSFVASVLVPSFMGSIDYVYNPTDAAWYAAVAPILWCFSFAWIVFTTHIGHKGLFGNFFSKPIFTIWTKISYTVYLTQFPAFFYNVGITRSPESYEFFRSMFNLKEFLWILALSCSLTLLFESPFQNIRNIIFRKSPSKISDQPIKKKVS